MCGRYFTDPSVAKELYDIFKIPGTKDVVPAAEDIHPADTADVLISTPKGIGFEKMRWGFPGFEKNKLIFNARKPLLMAGCWNQFGSWQRFVILTTEANESVRGVHHRMPLILDPKDAWVWLMDDGQTEFILQKTPGPLEKKSDYEQISFSFLFHKEEPL